VIYPSFLDFTDPDEMVARYLMAHLQEIRVLIRRSHSYRLPSGAKISLLEIYFLILKSRNDPSIVHKGWHLAVVSKALVYSLK